MFGRGQGGIFEEDHSSERSYSTAPQSRGGWEGGGNFSCRAATPTPAVTPGTTCTQAFGAILIIEMKKQPQTT